MPASKVEVLEWREQRMSQQAIAHRLRVHQSTGLRVPRARSSPGRAGRDLPDLTPREVYSRLTAGGERNAVVEIAASFWVLHSTTIPGESRSTVSLQPRRRRGAKGTADSGL